MADPSNGSITLSIIAIIVASMSAAASWFMAIYSAFAKGKLKVEMHKDYADLATERIDFWGTLNTIYELKRRSWANSHAFPEKLHDFIISVDNPPHVKGDVASWVQDNLVDPKSKYFHKCPSHRRLWELASFIYPEQGGIDIMFIDEWDPSDMITTMPNLVPNRDTFHSTRAKLAWFWDKWMLVLRTSYLTKHYDSAKPEVHLLVWLELALAHKIRQPGKGKTELLKFSRKFDSTS